MTADPSAVLGRLVGDPAVFAEKVFGRSIHLRRSDGDRFQDLLSLDAVDEILATRSLRAPSFRLVRDGEPLPPASYTRPGTVGGRRVTDLPDVGRIHGHFGDGATIVLQGLQRWWQPITRLCRGLELSLTHPVQANAYLTPPSSAGLDVHHDTHDVLAIQIHGTKHWVAYEPVVEDPLPDQHWAGEPEGDPVLDTRLEPGDVLYLPRGTPHAAETVDAASIHLTVGIRTLTWNTVARRALAAAADEPALREGLPAGFARDPAALAADMADRLRLLADVVEGMDPVPLLEEVVTDLWSSCRPVLDGQLGQLLRLDDVDDDTRVSRRPGAVAHLVSGDDRLRLVLGDREVGLPARVEPALRRLLEADRMPVAALEDLMDRRGRGVLVRRLIREGLLVADHGTASEPSGAGSPGVPHDV